MEYFSLAPKCYNHSLKYGAYCKECEFKKGCVIIIPEFSPFCPIIRAYYNQGNRELSEKIKELIIFYLKKVDFASKVGFSIINSHVNFDLAQDILEKETKLPIMIYHNMVIDGDYIIIWRNPETTYIIRKAV